MTISCIVLYKRFPLHKTALESLCQFVRRLFPVTRHNNAGATLADRSANRSRDRIDANQHHNLALQRIVVGGLFGQRPSSAERMALKAVKCPTHPCSPGSSRSTPLRHFRFRR